MDTSNVVVAGLVGLVVYLIWEMTRPKVTGVPSDLSLKSYLSWPWELDNPSQYSSRFQKFKSNLFEMVQFGAKVLVLRGSEHTSILAKLERGGSVINSWPAGTQRLLGDSVPVQTDPKTHARYRKIISSGMTPDMLKNYVPMMAEVTKKAVLEWSKEKGPIDLKPRLKELALVIACRCLLGLDFESAPAFSLTRFRGLFNDFLNGLFGIQNPLPWTAFGKAVSSRKHIIKEIDGLLENYKENDGPSMLKSMKATRDEDGNTFTRQQISDQVLIVLFAGHDTTNSSLVCILSLLLKHPEWMKKCIEEQEKLEIKEFDINALKEMKVLEACIQEGLRVYPPVAAVFKKTVAPVQVGPAKIPADTVIVCSLRDGVNDPNHPDYSEKRWTFDPSRWMQYQEGSQIPTESLFGFGKHACPGKNFALIEVKTVLAVILRTCLLSKADRDEEFAFFPIPSPKNSLAVHLSLK
jgi:cytochrome P450